VLRRAGRGFSTRLAIVVGGDGAGGDALVGALSAAGWRAGVAGPDGPLDAVWTGLSRRRGHLPEGTPLAGRAGT
jgi:NAD(P)-dependent dehydrogenase (short-subunit alcohol dehydrogenase family)